MTNEAEFLTAGVLAYFGLLGYSAKSGGLVAVPESGVMR